MAEPAGVGPLSFAVHRDALTNCWIYCRSLLLFDLSPSEFGGAGGSRTRDLLDAIEARSQLRYGPTEQEDLLLVL